VTDQGVFLLLLQTDVEIAHPDVVFYDYYGAWTKPIVSDTERYLGKWPENEAKIEEEMG
jgi:cellobiose dehydrogenase (acceptor)